VKHDAINAEISLMATDSAYQKEAASIAQEFAATDWEAFHLQGSFKVGPGDPVEDVRKARELIGRKGL
jgi:hypothetical protein